MLKYSILLILMAFSQLTLGQQAVNGTMTTRDSVKFSIIRVLPDSFPTISIIFKAHDSKYEPLWNLKKNDFKVLEDNEQCETISLTPISVNRSINLAIVLDHSNSMMYDDSQLFDQDGNMNFTVNDDDEIVFPNGYVSPINNAKLTTIEFANSFDFKKDSISIVGFSTRVDRILPLTNEKIKIDSVIATMHADSLTALYDAMLAGLDNLKNKRAMNVLVVLTDGQNNVSKHDWTEVIESARQSEIPIYIIGLGDVNRDTLQVIADTTRGEFIYTKTSGAFAGIYERIRKDIQSFYDLKYSSPNFSSVRINRQILITFHADTINYPYTLSGEVQTYLQKRQTKIDYAYGASIITAISLTAGVIIYRRRKRR